MPALSAADLALIRSAPPVVEYYLAIVPPTVMFQASVNNADATWGDTIIYFDNVTIGAWSDVVAGQTLRVYESDGVTFRGKARVRDVDATMVEVAMNSDVEWTDDDIIKVLDVFEPWSRPTSMEDTGDGIVYYKDGDVAWTDNNTSFPPKANDLGAWAGFLSPVGQAYISFDASDSFANAPGATIASYNRPAMGGTYTAGSQVSAAGTILYITTGFRWITQTVTDSNGKTGLMRMPVWTFGGGYEPFKDFTIKRRSSNGRDWELAIEAWGDVTEDDIFEGAQVVLFTRTYVDGVEVTDDLNSPFAGRQSIKFVGWILNNTVSWDYEKGVVNFTAGTIGKVVDDMPGYATFLEDVDSGSEDDWHTVVAPTVRSAIFFLLHWHTNIPQLCYLEIEPDELIAGRKFSKAPPFKQVETAFLQNKGVFANLGCSKWSSIHVRYDPQLLSDGAQALIPTVIDLTSFDWLEELAIEKGHRPRVSAVMGGGIYYDGTTGTPYRARAPGKKGLESGKDVRADNLIISGQADLNAKMGRLLESLANPWNDVSIATFYDIFEPALQEYVTLTVSAGENERGYALDTSAKWVVRRVDVEDMPNDTPEVKIEVEGLASTLPGAGGGYTGEDVPMPDPDGPPTPPDPEPPPDIVPPPPVTPATGDWVVVSTVGGAGVCYTKNAISGVPPTWFPLNDGLDNLDPIEWLAMDPTRPFRLVCIDGDNHVYTNVSWHTGGSWQKVLTNANAISLYGGCSSATLGQVHCGVLLDGSMYIVVVGKAVVSGAGTTLTWWSFDFGGSWNAVEMKAGKSGGYSVSSCEYLGAPHYWAIWGRTGEVTSGQLLPLDTKEMLAVGGRCTASGSQGRSNFSGWLVGGYSGPDGDHHPSWAVPPCPPTPSGTVREGLGGAGALGFDWNGPLAMCENRVTKRVYGASFKVHEDVDAGEPRVVVDVSINSSGGQASYSGEITPGLGDMPGQMFAPPIGISSVEWVGMRTFTDPVDLLPYTDIYKGPDISDGQVTISGSWRYGYSFPTLVDTIWAITYLGRSYRTGQLAYVGDPRVFLVGKNTAVNFCEAFADHTGNLYTLGARGITNICPDPTR